MKVHSSSSDPLTLSDHSPAGYLPQEPIIDEELTVLDAVLASDSDSARAVRDYQHALIAATGPEGSTNAQQDAMDKAMDKMNALNAWALDTEVLLNGGSI